MSYPCIMAVIFEGDCHVSTHQTYACLLDHNYTQITARSRLQLACAAGCVWHALETCPHTVCMQKHLRPISLVMPAAFIFFHAARMSPTCTISKPLAAAVTHKCLHAALSLPDMHAWSNACMINACPAPVTAQVC